MLKVSSLCYGGDDFIDDYVRFLVILLTTEFVRFVVFIAFIAVPHPLRRFVTSM